MDVLAWISSNSPNAEVLDVSTTPNYTEKEVAQAVQKSTSIFIFKYKCTRVHVYSCRTLISPFLDTQPAISISQIFLLTTVS